MFKPLTTGLFNVMSVNRKLREIWNAVEELQKMQGVTKEPIAEPETVTVDSAETVEVEAFDWQTTEDVPALKEWAMSEHGLVITGNKKADTIRKEIEAFLEE